MLTAFIILSIVSIVFLWMRSAFGNEYELPEEIEPQPKLTATRPPVYPSEPAANFNNWMEYIHLLYLSLQK